MQLYKTRTFSDYFSDTITFFRATGKHFFRNYILINGGFIIIIALIFYFLTKLYMTTMFSMTMNQSAMDSPYIFNYFADNMGLFVSLVSALIILSLFLSILNITFPIVYLQLYEKYQGNDFETGEIVGELKTNLGKMFRFLLGVIFIIGPFFLIIFGILILLSFILIGIPLMIITLPAMIAWISLSYHEYIIGSAGFFKSLGRGFTMLKQNFWSVWGATALWAIILQMLQGAVTMIPYIIGLVAFIAGMSDSQPTMDTFSTMAIFIAAMMVFAIVVSYFLNNVLIVAQGLIYFSIKEQHEHRATASVIDEIGSDY